MKGEKCRQKIIEQYYLWNEVAKKEIERYPWLILPLIQEVFHKVYPESADIAVQIGDRDLYHMECQMNKDKGMVLRMLEYDIHIGLVHGIAAYRKETCLIRFADGTTHEYRIPVMNVQCYTPEMIEKKHLNMLIPFLPIRFRKYFNRKNGVKRPVREAVRKDLTEFIRKCIMIIDREKENGTLTDAAGKDIIELLDMTCGYLLKNEPDLKKEVRGVMRPIVMTQTEKLEIITEKHMNAIRKFIEKGCFSGQSHQEVKESIQDIFSLDEAEAEEKMEKYWKQKDE